MEFFITSLHHQRVALVRFYKKNRNCLLHLYVKVVNVGNFELFRNSSQSLQKMFITLRSWRVSTLSENSLEIIGKKNAIFEAIPMALTGNMTSLSKQNLKRPVFMGARGGGGGQNLFVSNDKELKI